MGLCLVSFGWWLAVRQRTDSTSRRQPLILRVAIRLATGVLTGWGLTWLLLAAMTIRYADMSGAEQRQWEMDHLTAGRMEQYPSLAVGGFPIRNCRDTAAAVFPGMFRWTKEATSFSETWRFW